MEVEIFTLSGYAEHFNDKLVIVITFDTIFSNVVPAMHPVCALSLRLRFALSKLGEHPLKINCIDDKKEVVQTMNAHIDVNAPNMICFLGVPRYQGQERGSGRCMRLIDKVFIHG